MHEWQTMQPHAQLMHRKTPSHYAMQIDQSTVHQVRMVRLLLPHFWSLLSSAALAARTY